MFLRLLLPAAVLLSFSACDTQSAAPEWADIPMNFSVGLPDFKQLAEDKESTEPRVDSAVSPAMIASMQIDGEELPTEYAQLLARGRLMADPAQAEAGFLPDGKVAYGQALGTSYGSYYRNDITLKLTKNGSFVSERSDFEFGSCNCIHFPTPWGKIANTTISVSGACGLSASAYAKHTARLDFSTGGGNVFNLLSDGDNASHHTDQDGSCPPENGGDGGGGGGGTEGEDWYICYWVDYYNSHGQFTHRQNLGCEPVNVS